MSNNTPLSSRETLAIDFLKLTKYLKVYHTTNGDSYHITTSKRGKGTIIGEGLSFGDLVCSLWNNDSLDILFRIDNKVYIRQPNGNLELVYTQGLSDYDIECWNLK